MANFERKNPPIARWGRLAPETVRKRLATRKQKGVRYGVHPNDWKPEHKELLGKMPDEELAELTGRPIDGVRQKRTKLGIPTFKDRRVWFNK